MSFWVRLTQLFSDRSTSITALAAKVQQLTGYTFRQPKLLELALTHRSAVATDSEAPSNERLEFLGDSVLGLVVADQLYLDHPEQSEGDLTKTKAMLVNEVTLAAIAREIGLNQCVSLSPEELRAGGQERPSIVADAFEAIIGAIYRDGGYDAARDVVMRLIYTRKDRITTDESQRNYKGELLELVQSRGEGMPRYEVVMERGPDHAKEFHVIVLIGGQKIGNGVGTSKKEAEQKAASIALESIQS